MKLTFRVIPPRARTAADVRGIWRIPAWRFVHSFWSGLRHESPATFLEAFGDWFTNPRWIQLRRGVTRFERAAVAGLVLGCKVALWWRTRRPRPAQRAGVASW